MLKKMTIRFDSATVTLDQNHRTDKIILNVDTQTQIVPVTVVTPQGPVIVNYNWDPNTKTLTPDSKLPPKADGTTQTPPPGFVPPQISVPNPQQGPNHINTDTPHFFTDAGVKPTINPDGSLNGAITIIQYEELNPSVSFIGLNTDGSIKTQQQSATNLGHWLRYKDTSGIWHLIDAKNVPTGTSSQPVSLTDGTTNFDSFKTHTFLDNKDVAGSTELFTRSNTDLSNLAWFSPVIDQTSGQVTWVQLTSDGQTNLQVTQNGDHVILHEDPIHSFLVQTPLAPTTSITEVLKNNHQIIVEHDLKTNTYILYTISNNGGKVEVAPWDVNSTIREYSLATTTASFNQI